MIRNLAKLLVAGWLLIATGCESPRQPWAGTAYQPPQGLANPAQSIFTPTPEILPGRRAERVDTSLQDAQIEQLLYGQGDEN